MSLSSCSDCFSDLLCGEASSSIISSFSPEYSSNFDSQPAESISGMLEDERDVAGISSCRAVDQPIDASVRAEFVAWILKVYIYIFSLFQIQVRNSCYRAPMGIDCKWRRRTFRNVASMRRRRRKRWNSAHSRRILSFAYGLFDRCLVHCAGATILRVSAVNGVSLRQLFWSFRLLPSATGKNTVSVK